MLSIVQQHMLVKMYGFWLRREIWTAEEMKNFYRSQPALYRALKYLEESGLVYYTYEKDNRTRYYRLTPRGVYLSRIICSFADQSQRIKKLSSLSLNTELDMKIFGGDTSGK